MHSFPTRSERARSIVRPLMPIALIVAATLLLSGCVRVQTILSVARQMAHDGTVRHTSTHCNDSGNNYPTGSCARAVPAGEVVSVEQTLVDGDSPGYPGVTRKFQYLLAYLVSSGLEAPAIIESSAGEPLTFRRLPSYDAVLESHSPSGGGRRWVGYAADPIDARRFAGFRVVATFTPPASAVGTTVVSGAFHGLRVIGTGTPTDPDNLPPSDLVMDPTAPVSCDENAPDDASGASFSACAVELMLNSILREVPTSDFDELTELNNVPLASTLLAPDVRAPWLWRLVAPRTVTMATLRRRGLRLTIRPSERVDAEISLARNTSDGRWHAVLRHTTSFEAASSRTMSLRPSSAVLSSPGMRESNRLRVRIQLTDHAGNVAVVHRYVALA